MAFHTIWSVDLGKSALKAVKVRRDRGNVEILAVDKVDYAPSAAGPATGPEATAQVREALSVFRARNEVRDPLIVMHPGQGTFSRFIKIPAFDQKKLKDMVKYEASQQIPFPLDEVIWDYHVIEREYASGEEREVGLFAVRKEAIDDFLVDFTNEQLKVEMLTISYLATLNFVLFDLQPEEPTIVLDIGASTTDLILVEGRRFWIRPLPHSGNDVTRAMMARFKLDFATAEKLKIEAGRVQKQAERIFQAVIQPKLQELVQEVHRSIGFYRSQRGEAKFSRLYLVGDGSKLIGIKKYLQERLQIQTDRLDSITRLRVNREVNVKMLQAHLPSFACALGGALQAVGAGVSNVDLIPKEAKIQKEIQKKRKHVFFAAGIVLLAILIAHLMIERKVSQANAAYQEAQDSVPRLYEREVQQLYDRSQKAVGATMQAIESVAAHRPLSLEALRSLERVLEKIPTGEHADEVVRENEKAKVDQVLADYRTALKEKLWIPYLQIQRVDYPEEARKAAAAAKEKRASVPAYKVTAFVCITARETARESNSVLIEKFQVPLEKDLKVNGSTLRPEVKLVPVGASALNAVYYEVGRLSAADNLPQEGRPFYGEEAQWYMVNREPPEVKAEEAPAKGTPPKAKVKKK
ncbi:MAG: type IV pilus assembly protein PilM [Planctomycetota bacterium]